jgi:hypothetical protein
MILKPIFHSLRRHAGYNYHWCKETYHLYACMIHRRAETDTSMTHRTRDDQLYLSTITWPRPYHYGRLSPSNPLPPRLVHHSGSKIDMGSTLVISSRNPFYPNNHRVLATIIQPIESDCTLAFLPCVKVYIATLCSDINSCCRGILSLL